MLEKKIDFAELPDGSIIEMIENSDDPAQSLFAIWKNGTVAYAPSVQAGSCALVPWPRTDPTMAHIRLPQEAQPFRDVRQLIGFVQTILSRCLDFDGPTLTLMATFILGTWLKERQPVAPYLAFVGPPSSGKTTAMRVLDLLCYRSFLTADITSAGFYDLSSRMHPTLLLDETLTAGPKQELLHLLRSSSTPGFASLRKGQAFLGYGPKAFSWLQLPEDTALNSRCIILPTVRTTRQDLASPNDPKIVKMASTVRSCLLQFRLESLSTPKSAHTPAAEITGRSLDLYRSLAAPFDQDAEMREWLAFYISAKHQMQSDTLSADQVAALKVLYDFVHKEDHGIASLAEITNLVNANLKRCGEPAGLKPRKVGSILTSLSFTKRTRGNSGYFVYLDGDDRERLHKIVRQYAVAEKWKDCELCGTRQASEDSNARPVDPEAKKALLAERPETTACEPANIRELRELRECLKVLRTVESQHGKPRRSRSDGRRLTRSGRKRTKLARSGKLRSGHIQ